jgi:TPR repeat protein
MLSGCFSADPENVIALEKRLESGDASALAELKALAPYNAWAALATGRAYQLGIGSRADLDAAMQQYAMAQDLPGAWFNAGLVYSQYLFDGPMPDSDGSNENADNACFTPSTKSPSQKAVDCFSHAAESAHPVQARIALARIYQTGQQDVLPNPSQACAWYAKAAEEHDAEGRYQYAMCLLTGNGADQDVRAGMHLLIEAAKSYHVDAIRELSVMFSEDTEKAAFWMLLLSKVQPDSISKEARRYLASLAPATRSSAEMQLSAWLLAHRIPTFPDSRFTSTLPVSATNLN